MCSRARRDDHEERTSKFADANWKEEPGTRSVCTSSVRKKGISVAEIPEMKAVRERQGRQDDADQIMMVKADLFLSSPTQT